MITNRALQGQDAWEVIYQLGVYAFESSPPMPDKEEWIKRVCDRQGVTFQALFENDQPVSCAASTAMTQQVRGKLYPASAVWGVATAPSARRKGYCRQVMTSLLEAERQSGKVFSALYPFRESFYERMGYASWHLPLIARFSPAALASLNGKEYGGQVEVMLIGDGYEAYRSYMKDMRQEVHGMGVFDIGDPTAAKRNRHWIAFARVNGTVEGLMLYSLKGDEVSKFKLVALRFYYRTIPARCILLDWIGRHTDQAEQAEVWLPAGEHPETWISDLQVNVETQVRAPMGRVLSLDGLNGMEALPGHFTARISDPLIPENNGAWLFESCERRLLVSKAAYPEFDLSIQGLSALLYGTHDPREYSIHGWGNPSTDQQSVMRKMFPARTPYLHEMF